MHDRKGATMTNVALVNEYRLERAAQDARFDARPGAGSVDHTMRDTEEYRAYFGLGEYMGVGVETRLTLKSYIQAKSAERKAEMAAAERARIGAVPTDWLMTLNESAVAAAELERRLAEYDAYHAPDAAPSVELEPVDAAPTRVSTRRVGCRPKVSTRKDARMTATVSEATMPREHPPYRGTRLHSVRVPDEVWEAAIARAADDGTTLSAELVAFLRAYGSGERYTLKRKDG